MNPRHDGDPDGAGKTETITQIQLADAIRKHLDVDPNDIAGFGIDDDGVLSISTPLVALTREQAVGFCEALGLDPDHVVELEADANHVRYVTAAVVDHEIVKCENVIGVDQGDP